MTNANKISLFSAVALSAFVLGIVPSTAQAGSGGISSPALSRVKELIIQAARVGNNSATAACGSSSGEISTAFLKALKVEGVPVYSVIDAPQSQNNVARIDLLPEIVTLQRQGLDCTSWVSLTAQNRVTLQVPPIATPRSVMVTYWRGGLMITSTQTGHARAIVDATEKLSIQFAKQYKLDQPPPLPDFATQDSSSK